MEKAVRWGILSTGVIAANFVKTAKAFPQEFEVLGVASRTQESADRFAVEHGIARAYGSYEAMVSDPEIDIVYVATPHSRHAEDVELCLRHGKHVLCEKSLTVTAEEARQLYALAKEKNLLLLEAFWSIYLPIYQRMMGMLADGVIGEVRMVTAHYGYRCAGQRLERKMDAALAGGALYDVGVYCVGFAAMALGYRPTRIQAQAKLCEQGTDALSTLSLGYEGGAQALVACAIGTELPVDAWIYGSEGRIHVPQFRDPTCFTIQKNDGSTETVEMAFDFNGYEYELREAERCLRQGLTESPMMTAERSIAVVDIMDQARRQFGMRFAWER